MITFSHKGDFSRTTRLLQKLSKGHYIRAILEKYAQKGVEVLREATPVDTGHTAASWSYDVTVSDDFCSITWNNSSQSDGIPIVMLIQYGHGTRTGGYVQGRDFINPAIKPVFDEITEAVWKEVSKS